MADPRGFIRVNLVILLFLQSVLTEEEEKKETTDEDQSKPQEEKEVPEMRLYKQNHVDTKGKTPIDKEIAGEPFHVGQAIDNLFGHEPNCARAPLEKADELFDSEWYFTDVETILVLHDHCGSASDQWVTAVLEALKMRNIWSNYNIFAMDYPNFMCQFKDKVQDLVGMKTSLEKAAQHITDSFKKGMQSNKIQLAQVNLIGLGLGAQLAGHVGGLLKEQGLIKSIVGLDPTKFDQIPHVSKDDAMTVQLFHTDSKHLGTESRTGTADFVFNGAMETQPMCENKDDDCSHKRCFKIFTGVIAFSSRFQGWPCESWEKFAAEDESCSQNSVFISYPPDDKIQGTYFLRTGVAFPFGVGENGRKFDKTTIDNEMLHGSTRK